LARALLIAAQRRLCLGVQLLLLVAPAEAAAPPAGLEQPEQLVDRMAAGLVVALEHLVDEDPEALVERRLARDPEDARELVLQRARAVGLDVRRAEQQPVAAGWEEGLERGLLAGGDGARAGARVVL